MRTLTARFFVAALFFATAAVGFANPFKSKIISSNDSMLEITVPEDHFMKHTGMRKLDTGGLTITNKRLVYVGTKEQRSFPLDKVISVDPNLTAVVVSVEGRQKAMAFEAANPLIVTTIIRIAPNPVVASNIPRLA
jgi:hypothetical protein